MNEMAMVAAVTSLMLLEYFVFMAMVGAARGKAGIDAPAMSGEALFERTLRVQENTMEQLIYTVPALWLFGFYISAEWAAGLGAIFIVGRAVYCASYRKDPAKRSAGFLIGWLPSLVLLVGGAYGAISAAL